VCVIPEDHRGLQITRSEERVRIEGLCANKLD